MTPERIAELRRLCDAATPGPWFANEKGEVIIGNGDSIMHQDDLLCANPFDADLAAASRTSVPELLAEVERLTARLRLHELSQQPCVCSGGTFVEQKRCARCSEISRLNGGAK